MSVYRRRLRSAAKYLLALTAPLFLTGACSSGSNPTEANRETATVLGIGDSILQYNRKGGGSIPEIAADKLDRVVYNAAVGGAKVINSDEEAAAEGFDIRVQYENVGRTDFDWVILDGGGNDLTQDCDCGKCATTLDELVNEDGTDGEIVKLVRRIVADGAKVMYVGYYEFPDDADYGFNLCGDDLAEHARRLTLMADAIDGAYFVSGADVVTAETDEAFTEDRVHPTPEGSRLVGEHVGDAMLAAGG